MIRPSGVPIQLSGHIDADGELRLRVPALSGRDVRVAVWPERAEAPVDEERRRTILHALYGSVDDEAFTEPPDPPPTDTDELAW